MQHLDDGFLHAIADGEVPSEELVAVREHLDRCESCRARLDEARHDSETARELIALIEVPPPGGRTDGRAGGQTGGPAGRRAGGQWIRPLAWAATVALAAGIGYYGRGAAPFAAPAAEPLSIGRIDTVVLDVPAQPEQPREAEAGQLERQQTLASAPPATASPPAPAPARQDAAGARAEEEQASKRRARPDTTARLDEVVVTTADQKAESRDAIDKVTEPARERVANDARDQATQFRANRPPAPVQSVAGAAAESRLMAKSAPNEAATIISFPRAVELLGGRIKLIEGMVPARLEAAGRTVRVIYVIDEGNLVLAQVAATDSLYWNLSGPLSADSLAALRVRVR